MTTESTISRPERSPVAQKSEPKEEAVTGKFDEKNDTNSLKNLTNTELSSRFTPINVEDGAMGGLIITLIFILWPLSLILLGFGWKLWRDYSYLVNIAILKKVRLDESPDYTRRLRSRRISIIEVTKIKANYYCVTINYAVSVGSSLHEKLVVRLVTFNDLWRELEMKTSRKRRSMTEKLPTRADLPVPKLQYPLPGYLFCDSRGDKIAISIQNDVGWIFSD
jgi:hypothetical protein